MTTSNAPDMSSNPTALSPVCLHVDWCPQSEANKREHWSKKHRRNVEAKGQWLLAIRADGQQLNGYRRLLLSASLSLPCATGPSTTTTSPTASNPYETLSPMLSD